MPETRLHGKNAAIAFGGGLTGGVVACTQFSIDAKGAADDVTGMDSAGVKAFIAGLTEWTGSCAGFWVTGGASDPHTLRPGVEGTVTAYLVAAGVNYTGACIITSIKTDVDITAPIKISIDFQGTGALTYPAS